MKLKINIVKTKNNITYYNAETNKSIGTIYKSNVCSDYKWATYGAYEPHAKTLEDAHSELQKIIHKRATNIGITDVEFVFI